MFRAHRAFLAAGLAAVLLPAATPAAEPAVLPAPTIEKKIPEPQPAVAGWEALTSPAEARGLYDKAALEWLAAARKNPKSPGAELALRRIPEVRAKLTTLSSRQAIEALQELAAAKDAPVTAALAGELLVSVLREAGRDKEADDAAAGLGLIENWMMLGTFGRSIAATHDRVFEPEGKIDLAAEYDPGRYYYAEKNKWRVLPTNGRGEKLEPYEYLRPQGGACYLLAQLKADGGLFDLYLSVRTDAAFKVWVNGREICNADRYRQFMRREVICPGVNLNRDGWNQILIKLSSPAPILVRLMNGEARPVVLPAEQKAELHPLGNPLPSPAKGSQKAFPDNLRLANPETPAEQAALGVFRRLENMDDEAIALLKAAVAKEPTRAAWHYQLAEAYRRAEYLSAPARKNLSAAEYGAALRCDPGFVPAHIRMAEQLSGESHEEQALGELKLALDASPECAHVWLEMAAVARRLAWRNETRTWLEEAKKLAPELPERRLMAAAFHKENFSLDLAMDEYRELLKSAPGNPAYRMLLVKTLSERGEWKEALKLCEAGVKARPVDPMPRVELARCLASSGDYKKAAEVCRELGALLPGDASVRVELGGALLCSGDAAGAKAAYAEALALNPGDHRLRRLVERQEGINEDFSAAVALDIYKEREKSLKKTYDRADAVRILDQTVVRVYPDGSVSEFIADGQRLLTDKGVEKNSEIPVFGEVVEARTIGKDGSVHEPTPIPGSRQLTMPELEPGAVIEYKYRLDEQAREWGGFYLNKWYFRSPHLDEPHQVSDYIVMVPKNLKHKVVRHNFDVTERIEEKEGLIIYRWTARDRPRVDAEPHMEHFDHFLPFVEMGTERSWQDVADSFKSMYLGRTIPTAAVTEAARRAVEGKTTTLEKARALYDLVNERVRHRDASANAHQVLESGSGDPEMLFLALAAAAGLEVYHGHANKAAEFQGEKDEPPTWELPDEDLFKAELVGVRAEDGRIQWLDLSSRYMPFGMVRQYLEGARVLAIGRGAAFFDRLPRTGLETVGTALEASLELDAAGNLKGTLREHAFGATAAALKELFAQLDGASCRRIAQQQIERSFRGANLVDVDLPGIADAGTPLVTVCHLERNSYLQAGAPGRMICPPGLRPSKLVTELAMDQTRKFPLKLSMPRVETERLTFRLAPELAVASLPADTVISGDFGTYALVFERVPGGFQVNRRTAIPAQTIAPADYEKFVEFCKRVDEAEKAQVILSRQERK